MKKLALSVLAVAFAAVSAANAQDFKPTEGNVTADLGVFSNGIFAAGISPVNLLDGMLKGRYFLADDMAIRGAFGIGNSTNVDTSVANIVNKQSQSTFALTGGIEKHFAGTERLSPYVGCDLGITSSSSKTTHTDKQNSANNSSIKTAPVFGIGVSALFGADYYIAKKLYLGVEAGLRFGQTFTGKSTTTVGTTTTTSEPQGSASAFNAGLLAGFKIGFVF